ncbi:MAG: 4Fe-4S binding protein [Barnesiella sp.]|nr:4Fe-4S binding protein [Barnesiella sp.]
MDKNTTVYRQRRGKANESGKAMQAGRRLTAFAALCIITVYFAMIGSSVALRLEWIMKVQIVPVALSVSGSLILIWGLLTLLFGRIYCSMVCPAGITQDIAARLPRASSRLSRRHPYRYHQPHNRFRYAWLAVTVVTAAAGLSIILSLFDPDTAFSRIMTCLVRPLIDAGAGRTVAVGSAAGIVTALLTLAVIVIVPLRRGRLLCNTVCPVGAALSLVSRNSVYRMDINTDLCVNCGRCEGVCKAECIDYKEHSVDMSRCVVCFNCTAECENGAITYTRRRHHLSIPMLMKQPPQRAATMSAGPAARQSITSESTKSPQ